MTIITLVFNRYAHYNKSEVKIKTPVHLLQETGQMSSVLGE